jgi:hypothetical protein
MEVSVKVYGLGAWQAAALAKSHGRHKTGDYLVSTESTDAKCCYYPLNRKSHSILKSSTAISRAKRL